MKIWVFLVIVGSSLGLAYLFMPEMEHEHPAATETGAGSPPTVAPVAAAESAEPARLPWVVEVTNIEDLLGPVAGPDEPPAAGGPILITVGAESIGDTPEPGRAAPPRIPLAVDGDRVETASSPLTPAAE